MTGNDLGNLCEASKQASKQTHNQRLLLEGKHKNRMGME
jgi:hypothetical protein